MMPWQYISALLGPGLLWSHEQEAFHKAIAQAVSDGNEEAAEHLRIMLANRNAVMFEQARPPEP